MNCHVHPEVPATGVCTRCGRFFCQDCLVEVAGKNLCRSCVSHAFDEKGQSATAPGQMPIVINNNASSSASAAATATASPGMPIVGTKSKVVAVLLAIFLGGIGVHKFYLGQAGMGILCLLFFWTGIPALIGFIEGIIYLTMSKEAFAVAYH